MFPRSAAPRRPGRRTLGKWAPLTLGMLFLAPLILAACGEARRPVPAPPSGTMIKPEAASTASIPQGAAVGDELVLGCSPATPCEVEFRVDGIQVSRVCENGHSDFHAPLTEEELLITIEGEATATRMAEDQRFHVFHRPAFEDSSGPVADAGVTSPCIPSDEDRWTHPIAEGETHQLEQTWVMPAHAEYVILGRHRFPVPEPS